MTEKFTQGAWQIEERSMRCGDITRFGFQVISPEMRKRVCYSETDDEKNIPEMQANAALIAAAPEMYRTLEFLRTILGAGSVSMEVDKVLKKARGEE